jgi:hypothetical protein
MKEVWLNQQRVKLDPAQLIQAGGEGMVFGIGKWAIKVYHQVTAQHLAKLNAFCHSDLPRHLPANVLAPQVGVHDNNGEMVGFAMRKMPADTTPLKQLANPNYAGKHNLDTRHIATLFSHIHADLRYLHQLGIVVGDLNDHNIHFQKQLLTGDLYGVNGGRSLGGHGYFWLDVDSYQFSGFPCPVALESSLDPHLYHVPDFSQQPYFSPKTDWYAFFVMLVKGLLQAHPYGGVHHQYKSLRQRAEAQISFLDSAVTYPQRARPLEMLSDELLHHLHLVFDKGQRPDFPAKLLADYAQSLDECPRCHLVYPRQRLSCPACKQSTPTPLPIHQNGRLTFHELLHEDGYVRQVKLQATGRMATVYRLGETYELVEVGNGGIHKRTPMFVGHSDYKFGFFANQLVVADELGTTTTDSAKLLILDNLGQQKTAVLETATFQNEPVFATSHHHLYRIANGYIMRGSMVHGHFVESIVADACKNQTQLWGYGNSAVIAGMYRIFNQHHFFLIGEHGIWDVDIAPLPPNASLQDANAVFNGKTMVFLLKYRLGGKQHVRAIWVQIKGGVMCHWREFDGDAPHWETLTGKALVGETLLVGSEDGILKVKPQTHTVLTESVGHVSSSDTLHPHQHGLLIQHAHGLTLATS